MFLRSEHVPRRDGGGGGGGGVGDAGGGGRGGGTVNEEKLYRVPYYEGTSHCITLCLGTTIPFLGKKKCVLYNCTLARTEPW